MISQNNFLLQKVGSGPVWSQGETGSCEVLRQCPSQWARRQSAEAITRAKEASRLGDQVTASWSCTCPREPTAGRGGSTACAGERAQQGKACTGRRTPARGQLLSLGHAHTRFMVVQQQQRGATCFGSSPTLAWRRELMDGPAIFFLPICHIAAHRIALGHTSETYLRLQTVQVRRTKGHVQEGTPIVCGPSGALRGRILQRNGTALPGTEAVPYS